MTPRFETYNLEWEMDWNSDLIEGGGKIQPWIYSANLAPRV